MEKAKKGEKELKFESLSEEALEDVAGGFIIGPLVKTCPYCGGKSKNKKVCSICGSDLTHRDRKKAR